MADIELVIKIPEGLKKDFEFEQWTALSCMEMKNALMNGTPLPKGHGDLIDKEKLKENINGWYAFMKDICKQPYMTLKQEEIIGKIDIITPIIKADKEKEE